MLDAPGRRAVGPQLLGTGGLAATAGLEVPTLAAAPRFIPDDIFQVAEIPRTLSGKKQELPIKKLLLGQPLEKVVNRDAMANPASLTWFAEFAAQRASASKSGAASA